MNRPGTGTPAPTVRAMIDSLVASPSVSSVHPAQDQGNRGVIDHLATWLSDAGFAVDVRPLAGAEHKANLVATLGASTTSGLDAPAGLVLAGHTDTVPCDPGLWKSDPFRVTERDGALYGLGTSDMKSFFALAIEAARRVRRDDLRAPLTVLATADEESTMAGARTLMDAGRALGRYALIGEPTGLLPVRLHKGIMMLGVKLTGRAGHSSNPAYGASALEGMTDALNALRAFRAELQRAHTSPHFEVPVPTLNLGSIHGGDNPNRICGECELWIDLRPLPGMDLDALERAIETRVGDAVAGQGLTFELVKKFPGVPPFETPASSEIVRVAEGLTGHAAGSVAFGTEGPFFSALGMETLVLGAGEISVAHQPDEHLPLDRIEPMVGLLSKLIDRFCVHPGAVGRS